MPLGLFLVAAGIGAFLNPDLREGLGLWKALVFDPILFYAICRTGLQSDRDRQILLRSLSVGAGIVALEGLLVAPWLSGQISPDGRLIGVYAQDFGASPNYLALYLAPLVVVTSLDLLTSLFIGPRRPARLLEAGILTLIFGLALVKTGSRGGVLAVVAGLVIGFGWLMRHWRPRSSPAIILIGLILVLASFGMFRSQFAVELTNPTLARLATSNNVRFEIWTTTLTTIIPAGTLLGNGFGAYQATFTRLTETQVNYPEYIAPYALHPHNFWLTTWVNTGFFGVIAWLAIFAQVWRLRSLTRSQLLAAAALVAWFVYGLIDTPYYKNDLAAETFVLLAVVLPFGSKLRPLS